MMAINPKRLAALVRKESLQVVRDPSAILIAFVLPVIMLFLFAYAVSLDIRHVRVGLVMESNSAAAESLAAAFDGTRYFSVTRAHDRRALESRLIAGEIRGYVVIPADFEARLAANGPASLVQVITDGSQPNTASFVSSYARGVIGKWLSERVAMPATPVVVVPRIWFNAEMVSRDFLVPGSIAIIMTMIGTLLTALVLAREWERGTMEAMLSTPAGVTEILIGKLLPYFMLAMIATLFAAMLAVYLFGVPMQGSWLALMLLSATFLIPALGQGLVISALAKNQFIAAQAALFSGFLPAFLLSGFIFEIDSMPLPIQLFTHIVAARYFIASLQTVFLAGDVWSLFIPDMAAMLVIGLVFFAIAKAKTKKSLDL